MLKFKFKTLIAFVILGLLIYFFRNTHGKFYDYAIVTPFIVVFWYLLGLKLAFSNLRNILFITLIFAAIMVFFRVIIPITPPIGVMGILKESDLNPERIGLIKESHDIALEIHFNKRPDGRERYFKTGDLLYTNDGLHYTSKKIDLDLSKLPKTVAWVKANLTTNKLDKDTDRVKSWFVKSMAYTLSPGALNSSTPLDQFLFEQRAGFCEHFAASFSTMLRLKGYSSRVSYGYAGGSWNPFLKVLVFENADAHAWVEVFNNKINQYEIIDPTSWVFPQIIEVRMIEGDFSWAFLLGLIIAGLVGIFFIRKKDTVELFMFKISKIEKKYGLESKGLTLSERVLRIVSIEQAVEVKMLNSLKIYLHMYSMDASSLKLDAALRKSLSSW